MDQVTISPDFTFEIPQQACEQAGFKPKQVLELILSRVGWPLSLRALFLNGVAF